MTVAELIEALQRYLREHPYSETTRVAVEVFNERVDLDEVSIIERSANPPRATLRIR